MRAIGQSPRNGGRWRESVNESNSGITPFPAKWYGPFSADRLSESYDEHGALRMRPSVLSAADTSATTPTPARIAQGRPHPTTVRPMPPHGADPPGFSYPTTLRNGAKNPRHS